MRSGSVGAIAALCCMFLASAPAVAQQVPLPPLNLGSTSFVDGVAGPGILLQQTLVPYHAGRFDGAQGQQLPGDNSVTALGSLSQVVFISRVKFLGAYVGAEILLPAAHVNVETDLGVRGSDGGVGDLILGPVMLQWPEHKVFGKPLWQRVVLDIDVPTGSYDRNQPVNVGSNLVSLNPHYAATLFLTPKLETSWRFHYLWNSRNNDPNPVYRASNIQPGQAFHFNAAVSYQVMPRLRIGVNAYYLKEITDPRIGGLAIPHAREQVGSIGPGMLLSLKPVDLILNAFFEMGAENRPQGVRVVVRILKFFPRPEV
jgi:hypothetical protein